MHLLKRQFLIIHLPQLRYLNGGLFVVWTIMPFYMPDYQNEPAGIEKLLPWSDFIKERCSGLIDVENQTPEHHEPLPV